MDENTETLPDIFRERHPAVAVQRFSEVATAIGSLIESHKLYVRIGTRKHVYIEGWQALGAPLGIFARVESSERIQDGDRWGYEAYAVAHRMGEEISAADAECWSDEKNWKGKDDFQVRSMAQTRACAKALRLALGFIMALGGFSATPAEEMAEDKSAPRPTMPKGKPIARPSQADAGRYTRFWTAIRALELPPSVRVCEDLLNVASLQAWEATGHTLEEAVQKVLDKVAAPPEDESSLAEEDPIGEPEA